MSDAGFPSTTPSTPRLADPRAPNEAPMLQDAWGEALPRPRFWRKRFVPDTPPFRLSRRRLRIMPSWYGAVVLFFSMGLLLHALQIRQPMLIGAFLVLQWVTVMALVQAHRLMTGVEVVELHVPPVVAGAPITLAVVLRSHRRWSRPELTLQWGEATARVCLPPKVPTTVYLTRPAPGRGIHRLGRLRCSSHHPFGLAHAYMYAWPSTEMCVYPAPSAQRMPLPATAQVAPAGKDHRADDEPHQFRPYRPGDSQRSISWKASARLGQWVVQERKSPYALGPVWLDWNFVSDPSVEVRCSVLARWIEDAERQHRAYGLRLPQGVWPLDQGPAHRHACLRALAEIPA